MLPQLMVGYRGDHINNNNHRQRNLDEQTNSSGDLSLFLYLVKHDT